MIFRLIVALSAFAFHLLVAAVTAGVVQQS